MRSEARRFPRHVAAAVGVTALVVAALVVGTRLESQEPPAGAPKEGAPAAAAVPVGVSALGRLEPEDGVRHVAGPSLQSVVVRDLLVDRGDRVTKGQLLAILDTADLQA